jgi:hypothetical protein
LAEPRPTRGSRGCHGLGTGANGATRSGGETRAYAFELWEGQGVAIEGGDRGAQGVVKLNTA